MTILPEESPHADSQSNGLVEGAVRDLKAVARSLRFAASELHQCDIGAKHTLLPWLVSYSGAVINRSQRGSDGLTPFRRWKGRDFRRPLPPFSEMVSFLPAGKNPSRVQDKWHEVMFWACWTALLSSWSQRPRVWSALAVFAGGLLTNGAPRSSLMA